MINSECTFFMMPAFVQNIYIKSISFKKNVIYYHLICFEKDDKYGFKARNIRFVKVEFLAFKYIFLVFF